MRSLLRDPAKGVRPFFIVDAGPGPSGAVVGAAAESIRVSLTAPEIARVKCSGLIEKLGTGLNRP